jgi:spore coat polysaccharide biosynthesis protein SpsF
MSGPLVVCAIQARTGSTRLPGKVLEPISGRPLVLWTVAAMQAVRSIGPLVVAIPGEPGDDRLADVLEAEGVPVHRGPARDVLRRLHDAVAPLEPDFVVRQTADNPFVDPTVVEAQITRAIEGDFDYLGIDGWPLGIAAEVARWNALRIADREASSAAEREHGMPFLYTRPERFRIADLPPDFARRDVERYTVDMPADLAFARALAEHLDAGKPPTLEEIRTVLAANPDLAEQARLNRETPQRAWTEAEVG